MHSLVLNRGFIPVHVTRWQNSMSLVYTDKAAVVDSDYQLRNFNEWIEISKMKTENLVHSVKFTIAIPEVIALLHFDRLPPQEVILTRESIFARDKFRCGYCEEQHRRQDLTWDHVIPRVNGGKNTWDNLVTCCIPCNQKKAGLTPAQAGMKLRIAPVKPKWKGKLGITLGTGIKIKQSWESWLDKSYWHVPLDED